jgi:hypothetical protein
MKRKRGHRRVEEGDQEEARIFGLNGVCKMLGEDITKG